MKAKIEVYSIFTELHGHHKSYTFSCRFYVPHPIPPQVCRALLELAAPSPFYTRKSIVKHIKMGVAARVRSPDLHAGETLVQNRAKTISKIFEFLYFVPNLRCVDACDCHTCSNATKQFLNGFPHMFGAAAILIGEPVSGAPQHQPTGSPGKAGVAGAQPPLSFPLYPLTQHHPRVGTGDPHTLTPSQA